MKNFFKNKSLQIVSLGFLLFGLFFLYFTGGLNKNTDSMDLSSNVTAVPGQRLAEQGFLVRLKIPKLEIDVDIEHVGLTLTGAMDVPKDLWDVAWFRLGPRPGEEGSAVIAGHRDSANGKAAVFYYLDKLVPGDLILVEDDKGESLTFIMREARIYASDAETTEVFSSESGIHLNLITCDGPWNKSKKNYEKRLVIFTDIVR